MKNGVLFLNMGGPDTLDDVRPFLQNLFSDNDIIPLPLGPRGMKVFGWLFAAARARSSRAMYARIGGGSPQRRVSERQGQLVAERLRAEAPPFDPAQSAMGGGAPLPAGMNPSGPLPPATALRAEQFQALSPRLSCQGDRDEWRSYLALRYTRPDTDDALRAIRADGIERLYVVPLYPQFATVTTGSSFAELGRGFARLRWQPREVVAIRDYHDDPLYLDALAGSVDRALSGLAPEHRREAIVVFSAHALPLRVVKRGDPYPEQVERSVRGAAERLVHKVEWRLAWQSQTRPFTEWLEPTTDHVVRELGRAGKKTVVMVPVAFVQEHVETLFEMDILYADAARAAGVERFVRVPALSEDPAFIACLAEVVKRAIPRRAGAGVPC